MQTESPDNQPFQLKNLFSTELLDEVAAAFKKAWRPFDEQAFLQRVFDDNWRNLELKQRMRHISQSLREHLPKPYPEALDILVKTTENRLALRGEGMLFTWCFLPDFVQVFGENDPNRSLPALETITRISSAEFAIRPFLLRYPARVYRQMLEWSAHESPMVRRLSSEGFRPRLPWGMGVPALKKDPSPILPVLESLKNDPAETVRRSVANNLNDISKDHPDLALKIAAGWLGDNPDTDWIVRHACRGLLKKGHPTALLLFGYDQAQESAVVENLQCSPTVQIGGQLDFSFMVRNAQNESANIRLEYAIDYLTSSGKISHKVFKIKEFQLQPGAVEVFSKYQRFTDFTTRKHFPGAHRLAVVVNGKEAAALEFEVRK